MRPYYYEPAHWLSGIALLLAFYCTFWPTPPRVTLASAAWALGALSISVLSGVRELQNGGIYTPLDALLPGAHLFGRLIPLATVLLTVAETVLLYPFVPRERALRLGRILFLAVSPALILVTTFPHLQPGSGPFPLGAYWLAFPLLWFRIRENVP